MGVLRNAKVAIRVLDLEEAVTHYCDYVGLYEVAREPGRVISQPGMSTIITA